MVAKDERMVAMSYKEWTVICIHEDRYGSGHSKYYTASNGIHSYEFRDNELDAATLAMRMNLYQETLTKETPWQTVGTANEQTG